MPNIRNLDAREDRLLEEGKTVRVGDRDCVFILVQGPFSAGYAAMDDMDTTRKVLEEEGLEAAEHEAVWDSNCTCFNLLYVLQGNANRFSSTSKLASSLKKKMRNRGVEAPVHFRAMHIRKMRTVH